MVLYQPPPLRACQRLLGPGQYQHYQWRVACTDLAGPKQACNQWCSVWPECSRPTAAYVRDTNAASLCVNRSCRPVLLCRPASASRQMMNPRRLHTCLLRTLTAQWQLGFIDVPALQCISAMRFMRKMSSGPSGRRQPLRSWMRVPEVSQRTGLATGTSSSSDACGGDST
jgi:hypothetical protein